MERNFELIKKFFENLKCSQCNNYFPGDSVQPVRIEENNIVVRITCSLCGKNMGLAILGLDKNEHKNSLDFHSEEETINEPGFCNDPITYEDVAEAHNFFSALEADWMKYLPKKGQE